MKRQTISRITCLNWLSNIEAIIILLNLFGINTLTEMSSKLYEANRQI